VVLKGHFEEQKSGFIMKQERAWSPLFLLYTLYASTFNLMTSYTDYDRWSSGLLSVFYRSGINFFQL